MDWIRLRFALIPCAAVLLIAAPRPARAEASLAAQAHAILLANCLQCHGANGHTFAGLYVDRWATFTTSGKVVPHKASKSRLIEVLNSGEMPDGKPHLSDADIATISAWIDAGAANWDASVSSSARKLVSEATVLKAIVQDLNAASERSRPFLRYFSTANLSNNPGISDADLQLDRTTLSKLINSLSWNVDVTTPHQVDAEGNVQRIDLRDYDWTPETWQSILGAYPYGYRPRGMSGPVREIQALSGVGVPYVRVDWFVASASIPPLYYTILQLPDTVGALEQRLGVQDELDVREDRVLRAGRHDSGVSRNNRAVERHKSLYGAYWKSFDFGSSGGPKNIFENPIDIHPDGGEFIFHLPNGLIAYYIANGKGKRLDEAPITIVRDHTNELDPVVRDGRSCIGCHTQGTKHFQDEMHSALTTQLHASFDMDQALALYPGQQALDAAFDSDDVRFRAALAETGSPLPPLAGPEPVNSLTQQYAADLTVEEAAADTGLSAADFKKRAERSSELDRRGFQQLLQPGGGIKRDIWEEDFGTVVQELGLGEYMAPTARTRLAVHKDNRDTIAIGTLTGPDAEQSRQARQDLSFWLSGSDLLRLVSDHPECSLQGSILVKNRDQISIVVGDPRLNLVEEATGASSDIHFLTQQLANRVHFRLTGEWLPQAAAIAPGIGAAVPVDAGQQIQQQVQGPVHIALTLDRGPGATYKFGEAIHISFEVDRNCYLTIFDLDSQGAKAEAFPNQAVTAGRVYHLDDYATITAGGVAGMETLIAVATSEPDGGLGGKSIIVKPGAAALANGLAANVPAETSTAVVRFFTLDDRLQHSKGLLEIGSKLIVDEGAK